MPYDSQSGDVTLALTGDAMITRALKPFHEPEFLGLRDLLSTADARITNGEMLFHNYENWPATISATWMRCDPRFLEDLKWFGINMVSCANNHGTDYGENGVLTNLAAYEAAELVHAGSGRHYADAVAPAYLDTPNGRVALIGASTSARAASRAGEQRRDVNGRPGINLIRWVNEWRVDAASFAAIKKTTEEFGWSQKPPGWWERAFHFEETDPSRVAYFADRNSHGVSSEDPVARFVESSEFGRHTVLHQADLERNLQSIKEAHRMSDWVVFTLHSHEGGKRGSEPAEHVTEIAHRAIEAGADVVLGHGPHRDRGIEIYQGKPIFYSVGTFLMQNDSVERLPHEAMLQWGLDHESSTADIYDARSASKGALDPADNPHAQSFVALVTFQAHSLSKIELQPIEFGYGLPRSQAGRPVLAGEGPGSQALARLQDLSEPFGTKIRIENGQGLIEF